MSALPKEIHSFLEQIRDEDHPSAEDQERAAKLLVKTLREKNIYLRKQSTDLGRAVTKLRTTRKHLEAINNKLENSLKTNAGNDTVH